MRRLLCLMVILMAFPLFADAQSVNAQSFDRFMPEMESRARTVRPHDMQAIMDLARRHPATITPRSAEDLPATFSWRNVGGEDWMSPVRDQGGCGSCWSFGALAAMEGHINLVLNDPDVDMDLSEQFMVSCGAGSCDSGGFPEEVLAYLKNHGIPDEACYPYLAVEGVCDDACADWRDRVVKIYDWNVMIAPSQTQLKTELLNGPMPVTMRVDSGFYAHRTGVFEGDYTNCGLNSPTDHVVTLVGWDDAEDSWIAKNSWGDDWGEDGYFRIKRGTSCLGTFSVNWLRVDPTTLPGVDLEIALCGPEDSLVLDVPPGLRAETPYGFDLTNCGDTAFPWTVRADAITYLHWLEVLPFEGTLGPGESVRIEIWANGEEKEIGATRSCPLRFTPKITGSAFTLDLTIRVAQPPDEDGDESDGDIPDGDGFEDVPDGDLDDENGDADASDGDPAEAEDPDGDDADGDGPEGSIPDGDESETEADPADGDAPDGDAPPVGGSGSACRSTPGGTAGVLVAFLLLVAFQRRRATMKG